MGSSISLGRYRGIPIGASWTTLLIIALISFNVAGVLLPGINPGFSWPVYTLAGVVGAVAFLASILLHELGHAVIAQRNEIKVRSITLWALGGVAQLEGEAKSPGADFRIAAVGPLVSFVLGAVFGMVAAFTSAIFGPSIIGTVLFYLFVENIGLAVFNVLPATPLDGGRILRAGVWKKTGDRLKAVVVSGRAGQGLGVLLMAYGAYRFALTASVLGGLWYVVLGFFLYGAATAEMKFATGQAAIKGRNVGSVTPQGTAVISSPGMTVAQVFQDVVPLTRSTAYPVLQDGSPIGVVRRARMEQVPPDQRNSAFAWSVMEQAGQLDAGADLEASLSYFASNPAAIVTHNGQMVGILTVQDVQAALNGKR